MSVQNMGASIRNQHIPIDPVTGYDVKSAWHIPATLNRGITRPHKTNKNTGGCGLAINSNKHRIADAAKKIWQRA